MAELAGVKFGHGGVERSEQGQPGVVDARGDDPAVRPFAAAGDEASLFQPVEQAGHVGVARDELGGNLATGPALTGAAQHPQHVELRAAQSSGFEKVGGLLTQRRGQGLHGQKSLMFGGTRGGEGGGERSKG